jgi:hypothetical protein
MQIIECVQGSEEWAVARRGVPSASNFDKIITPAKGELSKSAIDYACTLIAETIVPPNYWIGQEFQTGPMANGTRTEREARNFLELQLDTDIRQVGFVLTDDNRFGASPDGLIDPDRGVELKCPEHKQQIRYLIDGVLPIAYRPQVHGNMLVTGRNEWIFMSYAVGLPPVIVTVKADEYTLKLAEALESFWQLYTDLRARIIAAGDPVAAVRAPQDVYF